MSQPPATPPALDASEDYIRVAQAIAFIRSRAKDQPRLEDVAAAVHLSPFHLQRLFTRWAGISPKRFLQYVTLDFIKQRLEAAEDLLSASLAAGLSGPGRLHDLTVRLEAVTPGELKAGGEGVEIGFGRGLTPLGPACVGWSPRGVCFLEFEATDCDGREAQGLGFSRLRKAWPKARLSADPAQAQAMLARVFRPDAGGGSLSLWVQGTTFQIQVWRALLSLQPGTVTSYSNLAKAVGRPKAVRAVGTAIGENPVAWLIPCHRVLRKGGGLGGYAWGLERKVAALVWEQAHNPTFSDEESERPPGEAVSRRIAKRR